MEKNIITPSKNLGLGTESLENLIINNRIYVDKTKYIYNLINGGDKYFLSRPRRFGKTLLVDTMEELFSGNKKLFKNTFIYDKWDWNKKYPIININMAIMDTTSPEKLESDIIGEIKKKAKKQEIQLSEGFSYKHKFAELIEELSIKTNSKVTILIDEYDKPIIDNISDYEIADKNRKILKGFYGALKGLDKYLNFVFITGVSKFSKVSLFSDINNLTDISLNEKYSSICGYTQEELETNYNEYIEKFSNMNNKKINEVIKEIKKCYDGYSWDGKNFLYNPYSIVHFFDENKFENYWFESATPEFLIEVLKEKSSFKIIEENIQVKKSEINKFTIKNISEKALFFQTGYLTIKSKEESKNGTLYTLAIPNYEVKKSLYDNIYQSINEDIDNDFKYAKKEMWKDIINKNSKNIKEKFEYELSKIPYFLKEKNENYYHSLFLMWLNTMDMNAKGEISTIDGSIDTVLEEKDFVAIVEVKFSKNKNDTLDNLTKKAIKQIKDKKYYRPYLNKKVKLVGLAVRDIKIDNISRTDLDCKIEELNL